MTEAETRFEKYINKWAEQEGVKPEELEDNLIVKEYKEWVVKELEDKEKANDSRRESCDT